MKKPRDLVELLKELKEEPQEGHIRLTARDSSAVLRTEDEDDDDGALRLNAEECELLLCSANRVDQLYDALGSPADMSIELHGLELEQDVLTLLEKLFLAVDEM